MVRLKYRGGASCASKESTMQKKYEQNLELVQKQIDK